MSLSLSGPYLSILHVLFLMVPSRVMNGWGGLWAKWVFFFFFFCFSVVCVGVKWGSSSGGEKWSTGRDRYMSERTRPQASCFMVSKDNYKTTPISGGCQSEYLWTVCFCLLYNTKEQGPYTCIIHLKDCPLSYWHPNQTNKWSKFKNIIISSQHIHTRLHTPSLHLGSTLSPQTIFSLPPLHHHILDGILNIRIT